MQALLITIILFICAGNVYEGTTYLLKVSKNQERMKICVQTNEKINEESSFTNENWKIEIPKINLSASINYDTTQEVMNKYVGHFNNTSFWDGNIGLAAHNRGYPVNYFGNIKELQIGDEIKYTTVFGTRTYKVATAKIITDTDWSYLQQTEDNRLTLITCVENKPNYRRCVQAIEYEEVL